MMLILVHYKCLGVKTETENTAFWLTFVFKAK